MPELFGDGPTLELEVRNRVPVRNEVGVPSVNEYRLREMAAYLQAATIPPSQPHTVDEVEHDKIAANLLRLAADIEASKRPAYTRGSQDVHANFRRIGEITGLSVGQVLSVYYLKHVLAIVSALCAPEVPQAENVEERIADAINYEKLALSYLKNGR